VSVRCPSCGAAVEAEADLCFECGEPIVHRRAAAPVPRQNAAPAPRGAAPMPRQNAAPAPQSAAPLPRQNAAVAAKPAVRRMRRDDDDSPARCRGCGTPSRGSARCPGCGARMPGHED
jgi:predicted amidophosphoribosyltransferase